MPFVIGLLIAVVQPGPD